MSGISTTITSIPFSAGCGLEIPPGPHTPDVRRRFLGPDVTFGSSPEPAGKDDERRPRRSPRRRR